MPPVPIELPDSLTGDAVVLRRLRADDAPTYAAAFRDDPELGRLLGMEEDPGEEQARERAASDRRNSRPSRAWTMRSPAR